MAATGTLSKGITLGYSVTVPGVTFTNLPDLQDIPELGGDVEKVEVTTLADANRKYINGIKDFGDLAFTFLYENNDATDSYRILSAMTALTAWQVKLPDNTTFTFNGFPSVKLNGAGVNEPLTFTLNIALNSDITVGNPA